MALLLTWSWSGSHARPRLHLWATCEKGDHGVNTAGWPLASRQMLQQHRGLTLTHHQSGPACARRLPAAPLSTHPTSLIAATALRPRRCLPLSRAGLHVLCRGAVGDGHRA